MSYKSMYKSLDAEKMVLELKKSGSVSVVLSKRRARLATKGVELLSAMLGKNIENASITKLMFATLRYIFLFMWIKIFHSNLRQIFKFYYACEPDFTINDSEGDFDTINFLEAE